MTTQSEDYPVYSSPTISQLVETILEAGIMTREQEDLRFQLIGGQHYTLEDMQRLDNLVRAIKRRQIHLPDQERRSPWTDEDII